MKIDYKVEIEKDLDADEIVDIILKSRNIKDVPKFLNPNPPFDFSLSDFEINKKDISNMIGILKTIKTSRSSIVVYMDYDADGITGGTILWETLYLLGFNVMPYVPHRKNEGYGFSKTGIDNVKSSCNPSLIFSVDHGICAKSEVSYAKKLGIDIIVTDHHQKQDNKHPKDAVGIFHIPSLSGSGTAYVVAKEIFENFKANSKHADLLCRYFKSEYLALAAIGTVADLVPLIGNSRSIVLYGLKAFGKKIRPGIAELIRQANIEDKLITPYDIGFILAPRINAIGRLEHAIDALRLLCTKDNARAKKLASYASNVNTDRQNLVKQQFEEAEAMVKKMKQIPKIIILYSPNWHEGVIGLIAGKILEQYYRPAIIMTENNGVYKASVRSIVGFNITKFLKLFEKYLINYGGHAAAAGFSLEKSKAKEFIKAAQIKADTMLKDDLLVRRIEADLKMSISQISKKLIQALEKLEPFGIGNPKPKFYSTGIIAGIRQLGASGDHLKLTVKDPKELRNVPVEMIAFKQGKKYKELSEKQEIQIVYNLDLNKWGGVEKPQGIVSFIEV